MIRARVIKIEKKSHVRIKLKKKKKARARINFFRRGIQRTTWEAKSIVHFCLPWISADANPRWRAFVRKQFTRQWTPGSTRFTVRIGAKKGDPYTTDSLLSLPRENYYVAPCIRREGRTLKRSSPCSGGACWPVGSTLSREDCRLLGLS